MRNTICVYFSNMELPRERDDPRTLTALQIDDTITMGNLGLLKIQLTQSQFIECNAPHFACIHEPFLFNGSGVTLGKNAIKVHAFFHITIGHTIRTVLRDREDQIAQRTRGTYIASLYRSKLSSAFPRLAQ